MGTDLVLDSLSSLAEAAFPAIFEQEDRVIDLFEDIGGGHFPSLSVPSDHPSQEAFLAASATDPQLARLVQSGDTGIFITASTGSGWRIRIHQVASALVGSAAAAVVVKGRDPSSPEVLKHEVAIALDSLRALLSGESAHGVLLQAFGGFSLAEGKRLSTPWGTLRPAGPLARTIQPFRGDLPSVVLEASVPIRYRLDEPSNVEDRFFHREETKRFGLAAQMIPLSLVLASEDDTYVLANDLWQTSVIPAQLGWRFSWRTANFASSGNAREPLNDRTIASFTEWAETIDDAFHPSIRVAMVRALSALRERVGTDDALIDAVVGWENLMGGGGVTEVTFRVTSALSYLLESDPGRRAVLANRLRKIYRVRSKVLHGLELDSKDDIQGCKETAIRILIEAIRTLLKRYPDLTSDHARGMRFIIGNV